MGRVKKFLGEVSGLLFGSEFKLHGVVSADAVVKLGCTACTNPEYISLQIGPGVALSMPEPVPFHVAIKTQLDTPSGGSITTSSVSFNQKSCPHVEDNDAICPYREEIPEYAARLRAAPAVLEGAVEPYAEEF